MIVFYLIRILVTGLLLWGYLFSGLILTNRELLLLLILLLATPFIMYLVHVLRAFEDFSINFTKEIRFYTTMFPSVVCLKILFMFFGILDPLKYSFFYRYIGLIGIPLVFILLTIIISTAKNGTKIIRQTKEYQKKMRPETVIKTESD